MPVSKAPGNRCNESTLNKLTRAVPDEAEEKASIFRPKVTLSVNTWNVRSIMNDYAMKLLVHELTKFNCDIVGISETHRLGTEEIEEEGFKIITSGKEERTHRRGVALVLSKVAQQALIGYNPISDRILTARFHAFTGEMFIIQVYAPTAESRESDINDFYDTLQSTITAAPPKACIVLMGDFNAKVGDLKCATPGIMGNFGFGHSNLRGEQLINFCGICNLVIANTLFKQKKENRCWTWESPDGKVHSQIDYIIISRKWRSSITSA